jgi:nitrogen fixation protein NifB
LSWLCKALFPRQDTYDAGVVLNCPIEEIKMKAIIVQKSGHCRTDVPNTQRSVIELPVAPRINARIRFSSTNPIIDRHITPWEALDKVVMLLEQGKIADRISISGPGDPLACIEPTQETLALIHERFPGIPLSVRTLGIGGEKYASRLSKVGVTHADLQVNAVTEDILEKLYAWIRPGFKTIRLQDAAKILVTEQKKAVRAFKDADMSVSIVTTVYPENNADHVESIAHLMADLGADDMVLVPYQPEEGAEINLAPPDKALLEAVRKSASHYITVSEEQASAPSLGCNRDAASPGMPTPTKQRPNVAVVSSNGMEVDLHLGEAIRVLIYGPREDGLACLLESRQAPEPGGGETRWETLADILPDCFVLLAASAGENPRKILGGRGIKVLITDDSIEGTVDVLYGGGKKMKKGRK